MRVIRLILSLYIGFLFGTGMLLFWGHSGIYSYNKLVNYRNSMEANIKELEQINQQLSNDIDALGSNPEIVALKARELGFFRDDEQVIKIQSYSTRGNTHRVGRLIYKTESKATRDIPVKMAAIFLPLFIYLFSHIILKRNADKYR